MPPLPSPLKMYSLRAILLSFVWMYMLRNNDGYTCVVVPACLATYTPSLWGFGVLSRERSARGWDTRAEQTGDTRGTGDPLVAPFRNCARYARPFRGPLH